MKNTPIKAALVTPVPTFFVAILLGVALVGANAAESSDQESQTEKLAKETQNPVANLISVPFQNNFNFGIGPNDATQWVLNIQPVIPITLNKDWNLITRTIVPIINQPSPAPGIRSAFGLGDINPSLFLSPANSGKLIWGVGPTLTFPTATDSLLGTGPSPGDTHYARALGARSAGEQPVVVCGMGQEERELDAHPTIC
jgi:hypothetical protein